MASGVKRMSSPSLIIRGRRVALPDGIGPATIIVRHGVISEVVRGETDTGADAADTETIDAAELLVMPGVIDSHVHINEPGRSEWEGFESATRAAAAGGVTMIVDMPLNSIPATTTAGALAVKHEAADGRCHVDVGFWGGVIPGNTGDIAALHAAGVFGFKCFLVPSGVGEFPHVTARDLRAALPEVAALGAVLLVHAELPGPIERATAASPPPWSRYDEYLASRPPEAELAAIDLMIRLAREFGVRVHIVHVAAAEALPVLRAAQLEGLPISAETCPHYLYFGAEEVPDGATEYKCAPPVRSRRNNNALYAGLVDGTLSLIASDHSPAPPAMKRRDIGDFGVAWGGIASLQLTLPIVWTVTRARGGSLQDLVRWVCEGPARLAGASLRKGRLAPGMDADLVIWDPDADFIVVPESLYHRHRLTPYAGRTLSGVVLRTIARGQTVYDSRNLSASRVPTGTLVRAL
jgi:allantoinase